MDRILIIQDSPSINAVFRSRLESAGFSVETAETGEAGVKKAGINQYQLILLDLNLPGIDGEEVCRILKGREETQSVPVVFISAKDEDKLIKIIKETGSEGYIPIPFEGKEFIKKIRGFIKRDNPGA